MGRFSTLVTEGGTSSPERREKHMGYLTKSDFTSAQREAVKSIALALNHGRRVATVRRKSRASNRLEISQVVFNRLRTLGIVYYATDPTDLSRQAADSDTVALTPAGIGWAYTFGVLDLRAEIVAKRNPVITAEVTVSLYVARNKVTVSLYVARNNGFSHQIAKLEEQIADLVAAQKANLVAFDEYLTSEGFQVEVSA